MIGKRRIFVPEVVQTSAMDCGPASLKALLEGFGIGVGYGRLREACQTDVDGTSIDVLESVANGLGLECEQVMLPTDHVLLPEAHALPAIVVVRLPNGLTHFEVAWRNHSGVVQVMDPASGRRFEPAADFLERLYVHEMPVPAEDFRAWVEEEEFQRPLVRRLRALGAGRGAARRLIEGALRVPGPIHAASLDAATRMVDGLTRSGAIARGRSALRVVEHLAAEESAAAATGELVPSRYWTARPADHAADGSAQVRLRGAVLVRALARRPAGQQVPDAPPLSAELQAALSETKSRPGRDLVGLLRADGVLAPSALVLAITLAAMATLTEALLFRCLLDVGRDLGIAEQRLEWVGALLLFVVGAVVLELPIARGLLRIGRHLEARLRLAFLAKIPRLGDRYFQSRLTSDMAERSHAVHILRELPQVAAGLLRSSAALLCTAAGLAWLDPASAPVAFVVVALSIVCPLVLQRALVDRDLRFRTHAGALSRFYLDAMLGLIPIRTHGAETSVRREHESLLVEWSRAGRHMQRAAMYVDAAQALFGFALAAWLVASHLDRASLGGSALLFIYWSLQIPALGQEVAVAARQYPSLRNVTLRLLEPLGAPEEPEAAAGPDAASAHEAPSRGADVLLEGVTVRASGHVILDEVSLAIPCGSHVAIVGSSGAGKSTLVGLLLGWQRPAAGEVKVDGRPLAGAELARLRTETAWVDPAVALWNRSLLANLVYGAPAQASPSIAHAIEAADLHDVLDKLEDGLQTPLGESGALVSGGQGQRVRLGRAMLRPDARLVILDEAFRGLGRDQREALLARVREYWRHATLLCITHDVGETRSFERVLVVDGGRVVEDGPPARLAADASSRYRALLDAEDAVRDGLWSSAEWQRAWVDAGSVQARGDTR
jgi:ATP-binding cassette subfamily B protein